jgi:hypothetical protein
LVHHNKTKKKKKAHPSLWHTPKIEPIHKASEVSMVSKIVATPKIDKNVVFCFGLPTYSLQENK